MPKVPDVERPLGNVDLERIEALLASRPTASDLANHMAQKPDWWRQVILRLIATGRQAMVPTGAPDHDLWPANLAAPRADSAAAKGKLHVTYSTPLVGASFTWCGKRAHLIAGRTTTDKNQLSRDANPCRTCQRVAAIPERERTHAHAPTSETLRTLFGDLDET